VIAGLEARNGSKWLAELLGTFWLVLGGCGSAVLAAAYPTLGIGFTGVSLAFGLTVLTGAYALGRSRRTFQPAVSIGLWAGGRFAAATCRATSWRSWSAR
jgi:aquaporin Z